MGSADAVGLIRRVRFLAEDSRRSKLANRIGSGIRGREFKGSGAHDYTSYAYGLCPEDVFPKYTNALTKRIALANRKRTRG